MLSCPSDQPTPASFSFVGEFVAVAQRESTPLVSQVSDQLFDWMAPFLQPAEVSRHCCASNTCSIFTHSCSSPVAPSPTRLPINMSPKVWLITGCSSGLGHALALAALARGDLVIATARDVAKLQELQARGAVTLPLDVTASDDVLAKTAADAVALYGRIDILVNNAGYALQGAVEECR